MKKKNIVIIIACSLLIITAVYQHFANKQDILSLLRQVEPASADYNEIKGSYKTYELIDNNGEFLSYAVISSASGYGGPITMLTTVNGEGIVENAVILENAETPAYLERVVEAGYPDNLQGAEVIQSLKENEELDAVSGATRTTDGILAAVEKGMFDVGEIQLGLDVPALSSYQFQWEDGAIVLLLLTAILATIRKLKKLRVILLIASVVLIGFILKSSVSIGNFMSIITNKMPVITERPIWYILIIGILVFTLIIGKNFYCGWLCPFGAVQEGIYKALNLTKNKLDQRIVNLSRQSRWFFIWLAAILAFTFNNPGIASYEPFAVFFGGEGHAAQWIIMGLVLLLSIFILRFWCRCFCPVGAVLDFVATVKRKVRRFVGKKTVGGQTAAKKTNVECSKSQCSTCKSGCNRDKIKTMRLSAFNKTIAFIILLVDLLIIGVLLQNTGLL